MQNRNNKYNITTILTDMRVSKHLELKIAELIFTKTSNKNKKLKKKKSSKENTKIRRMALEMYFAFIE